VSLHKTFNALYTPNKVDIMFGDGKRIQVFLFSYLSLDKSKHALWCRCINSLSVNIQEFQKEGKKNNEIKYILGACWGSGIGNTVLNINPATHPHYK
jgi:hypothetical protein